MRLQFPFTVNNKVTTLAFFVAYFIIGLLAFQHYGIAWDDECSRVDTGHINYNYIAHHEKEALLKGNEKYHGPFFEIVLVGIEKALRLTDMSDIYWMRHLVLFLVFFLSIIAFYLTARKLFEEKYALLACLFLVLSPRIFAESFYNSKDVLLLSFFNFSLFAYFNFFEKRNLKWAFLHGMFTGFLIAIRIVGVVVPLLTVGYFLVLLFLNKKEKYKVLHVLVYLLVAMMFTTLCWPVLWEGEGPWYHFGKAFAEMKKYHWESNVLYQGNHVEGSSLPWHYLPVWIFITTPVLYTILFVTGMVSYLKNIFTHNFRAFLLNYQWNSVMVFFLMPILSVIVLHSVIYDGWRHLYFVYPLFILIVVYGLKLLFETFANYKIWSLSLYLLTAINSTYLIYWMVKNHPHQQVYFNSLSRKIFHPMQSNFELDYWGVSYKQGLEYLLNTHKEGNIKVSFLNSPGNDNCKALPLNQRKRFEILKPQDTSCEYFLTNYRWEQPPSNWTIEKQIFVDDIPILGIYKMK